MRAASKARSADREIANHRKTSIESHALGRRIRAYFALTKPRIIELLLVTTIPAMVAAQRGIPPLATVAATLLGGSLSAGGANAINNYFDKDIDERMARTKRRPLPSGELSPAAALTFGSILGAMGFFVLGIFTNWLAAFLATSALAFYVIVYTLLLKRRTTQNIVIGGAAGGVPALVGWAAVRGKVEVPAVVLFFLVFYWTPPHFWALAIKHVGDYRSAGVPMLPVTKGIPHTTRLVVLYSWLTVSTSLIFFAVGGAGVIYLASAALLGADFLRRAYSLRRATSETAKQARGVSPDEYEVDSGTSSVGSSVSSNQLGKEVEAAFSLFKFSNIYLALLSASVVVDILASAPRVAG